jgi:predicted nuclease of predicted toxin-antitoxin system
MRIMANENITASVIGRLRAAGHDVLSVKETMRGAADPDVLSRAHAEQRLLITHDKDFGELAFRSDWPADCGVVLFRLSGNDPDVDNRRIIEILTSRTDWEGHFSVVDDLRIRMRPLPSSPTPHDSGSDP